MKMYLLMAGALTLAGCGFFGNDRSDEGSSPREDQVHFEAGSLEAMDRSADLKDQDVVWTYRFAVGEELRALGTKVALTELANTVAAQTFPREAALTFELTASNAVSGELLVSNFVPDGTAFPEQAKKWHDNCADVSPRTTYEAGVKVCDFASILVHPTVRIKPANFKEDPRRITWECVQANDARLHDRDIVLYAKAYATCRPGYAPLSPSDASHLPELTLPADLAGHTFEMQTINSFLSFIPGAPASRRYKLDAEELDRKGPLKLPVGKMEDCSQLEVQLLYKTSAGAGAGEYFESRLKFHRELGASHLLWHSDDQTSLPTPTQIYAADQEQIRFWLTCTWYNQPGIELAQVPY